MLRALLGRISYYTKFLNRRLRKMVKFFTKKGLYKDLKIGYHILESRKDMEQ
jgi:hypothetical protein